MLGYTIFEKQKITEKENMKKKKEIMIGILIILCLIVIYAPPIMIAHGAPTLEKHTEGLKTPEEHLADRDKNFVNNHEYSAVNFEHYYVLNLRFWQKLKIEQVEYYKPLESGQVKRITPFLYSVEHAKGKYGLNTFEVQRESIIGILIIMQCRECRSQGMALRAALLLVIVFYHSRWGWT